MKCDKCKKGMTEIQDGWFCGNCGVYIPFRLAPKSAPKPEKIAVPSVGLGLVSVPVRPPPSPEPSKPAIVRKWEELLTNWDKYTAPELRKLLEPHPLIKKEKAWYSLQSALRRRHKSDGKNFAQKLFLKLSSVTSDEIEAAMPVKKPSRPKITAGAALKKLQKLLREWDRHSCPKLLTLTKPLCPDKRDRFWRLLQSALRRRHKADAKIYAKKILSLKRPRKKLRTK